VALNVGLQAKCSRLIGNRGRSPFPVTHLRPEVEIIIYTYTYCACTDTVVTKVAENGVAHPKWPRLYGTRAHQEMRYPNVTWRIIY